MDVQERLNLQRDKKANRKMWKQIIHDLGSRKISIENIANGEKMGGIEQVMEENNATLNDLVVLSQYAKAIITQDTRAAEFLRDTGGEKPTNDINVTNNSNDFFADMSIEDLENLKTLVKNDKK